jgi:glycosyltransferase involved in cell wall biosynthesis
MPKLVATLPVRNEEWILSKTLTDLSTYVDEIVALDDGSSDKSLEILRECPKVVAIHCNPPGTLPFGNAQESTNRNKLLAMARQRKADVVLQIDADEMFEERIKAEMPRLLATGKSVKFKVCHLWRDTNHFRVDGEWGNFYRYRLYWMRRRLRFSPQPIIATPRAYDRKNRTKSDLKIVHYGWIRPDIRMKHLRRYYEVYKLAYSRDKVEFEEFIDDKQRLDRLKVVDQDTSDIKVVTWSEIMGQEDQEKYRL